MKKLIALALMIGTTFAQAAPVNLVIEGDFSLVAGVDEYNLDGAHFAWTMQYDSERLPNFTSVTSNYVYAQYDNTFDATIKFTNRPSSANDVSVSHDATRINTTNYTTRGGDYVTWYSSGAIASGEFAELVPDNAFAVFFNESPWGLGYGPLPESFDADQVLSVNMGNWFKTTGTVYYEPINVTASASIVPIPGAFWLLGSALLGLGAMKRKRA